MFSFTCGRSDKCGAVRVGLEATVVLGSVRQGQHSTQLQRLERALVSCVTGRVFHLVRF